FFMNVWLKLAESQETELLHNRHPCRGVYHGKKVQMQKACQNKNDVNPSPEKYHIIFLAGIANLFC
ncbi:MAG: hypothetical protein KJ717_02035, partial [Proteobacteria bacterium]|nr:hypothetical protein [Pseudomonadota bacterium]